MERGTLNVGGGKKTADGGLKTGEPQREHKEHKERGQRDESLAQARSSLGSERTVAWSGDSRSASQNHVDPVNPVKNFSPLSLMSMAVSNPVITSTVMVKKSAIEAAGGFDEQFRGPEDYDLWMRLVAKHECVKLDEPLVRYQNTRGSLSMDERNFLPQVLRVLDKAYGSGGALESLKSYERRARAYQYAGASWMAYCRGARWPALLLLARSFAWRPWVTGSGRWKLAVRYLFGRSPRCK